MTLKALLLTLAGLAALAPPALGGSYRVDSPPQICSGEAFADQIGTNGRDRLVAGRRAERLWGLAGPDVLKGSPNRATCLFGGRQGDALALAGGGGAAFGEQGGDLITGSPADDLLDGGDGGDYLVGGPGNDWLTGAAGIDGFNGGPGDDLFDTADDQAEIVDCGEGADLVAADRADLLIGCERSSLIGEPLPKLSAVPRAAQSDEIVRARLRVPLAARAGGYRIVVGAAPEGRGCPQVGDEVTRLPAPGRRVRKGQTVRIGLRPPAGGWCTGDVTAVVALARECVKAGSACPTPPPPEPIARLAFRSR